MISTPKIGTVGELPFTVETRHGIAFSDDELPNVLSTPHLIWFMENAAIVVLDPLLENEESSVGVHVDVQHLAPTPIGSHVVCRARVVHVDGKLITFQVEAHDEDEMIARGMHKRRIIRKSRFAAAVRKKSGGAEA